MSSTDRDSDTLADAEDRPGRDRPVTGGETAMHWGSDAIAQVVRDLGVEFVALNPGASYRGLHDSVVNYLGNRRPQMLVCLHEEHAVALAHGYAKVTERPMAAIVHSNVGLMHATMAIYNAWCDRAPVIVIGATGPVDATRRRPWIDWIHTSRDQAAMVRSFVKWDDQPASIGAALESMVRAARIAATPPHGPVYVCLDAAIQEDPAGAASLPNLARHPRPSPPQAAAGDLDRAADWLASAKSPVILAGRVSRDPAAWTARVRLAERLGARVVTDLKTAASFPTRHPLHGGAPGFRLSAEDKRLLAGADVVLALDWVDLAGALRAAWGKHPASARVISASLDGYRINGWSLDHQALPTVDLAIGAAADDVVAPLLARLGERPAERAAFRGSAPPASSDEVPKAGPVDLAGLARCVNAALRGRPATILRLPLGWPGEHCQFDGPLDYLGYDGGGGIGSGPGMAVGSALALRGSGRVPIAILGDGDTLMGAMALWTAARHRIPMLVVVANNGSYHNDEAHQEAVARKRSRPVENKWIGQRLDDPPVDLPSLAHSQGWVGLPSVVDLAQLPNALRQGIDAVLGGGCCLIDVRTLPAAIDKSGSGDG